MQKRIRVEVREWLILLTLGQRPIVRSLKKWFPAFSIRYWLII